MKHKKGVFAREIHAKDKIELLIKLDKAANFADMPASDRYPIHQLFPLLTEKLANTSLFIGVLGRSDCWGQYTPM